MWSKQSTGARSVIRLVAGMLLLLIILGSSTRTPSLAQSAGAPQQSAAPSSAPPEKGEVQEPNPKLSPEEVVKIQLQALQRNDTPTKDSGIATAFKFASPGNKEATGPLAHFVLLVKSPTYRPMLNHRSAELKTIQKSDELAHLKATLVDAQGATVVYVFILSKQRTPPCKDCWMTDAVMKAPAHKESDQPVARLR